MTEKLYGYLVSRPNRKLVVTDFEGAVLGHVTHSSTVKLPRWSYVHGKTMLAVTAKDLNGRLWYGRSSPAISIMLRPYKEKSRVQGLKRHTSKPCQASEVCASMLLPRQA